MILSIRSCYRNVTNVTPILIGDDMLNRRNIIAGLLGIVMLAGYTDMPAFAMEIDRIIPVAEPVDMEAFAIDKVLPVAGLDLSLSEGMSVQVVAEEKGVNTTTEVTIVEPEKVTQTTEIAKKEDDYSDLVIADVNNFVNIRSIPSEEGEVVGKLYDNSVGKFIEEENGWYKIESGKCVGYVKAEYCVTGEEANILAKEVGRRIATVTTETLNVRSEANMNSAILGQAPLGEELTVEEEADGWVKIKIEEGSGYVSEEYVTLSTEFVKAESKEEEQARLKKEEEERNAAIEASRKAQEAAAQEAAQIQEAVELVSSGDASLGQQVADFAVQFVGNPYVYGGTSLTNGADCSGFTLAVYANFGVSLPHSAAAQNKKGSNVGSIDNAIPGDIVYYSGHVGIYIGNGQVVHAGNSRTGILISNADYDKILGVRRIF